MCAGDGGAVVADGDELFEAELVEVGGEVLEEVALEWVVAVAVDDLAAEGVGVELEVGLDLLLDVDILGVELVLLGCLRGVEASIQRLFFHVARFFKISSHETTIIVATHAARCRFPRRQRSAIWARSYSAIIP